MNSLSDVVLREAFIPAIIPCAAASSYPVVPLICPAKNKFFIFFVSSVCVNSSGSIKSYSMAYAGCVIVTSSKPFMVLTNRYCISVGREEDIPLG